VITVNGSDIPLGAFATASMNFFFVALVLFMVVKLYNRIRDTAGEQEVGAEVSTNDLLIEIRNELRAARGEMPLDTNSEQ
jgi:large-conductance mechanosensitive channel